MFKIVFKAIFAKKGQLSLIRLYETILDSPVVVNSMIG